MHQVSEKPALNAESASTILETVKEEYLSQERRHALIISKTQTLATVSALIFAVITASTRSSNQSFENNNFTRASLFFALVGVALCLYVLKSREFHKVNYAPALTDAEMGKHPAIVRGNLAQTYHEAVNKSNTSINKLVRWFDFAVFSLVASILLGGVAVWKS